MSTHLTTRFELALLYAHALHASQVRKASGIPYIAHLLSVAALVLEDGGDEDEVIAALLHDSIEDQDVTRAELEARFGPHVADIVAGCTDADVKPKPPWRQRKEQYLAHLAHAAPGVLRVSLADKLHNARTILTDYRRLGDAVWERFKGRKDGTLWYYRELVRIYRERSASPHVEELARVVAELERLAAASPA
jgi:(p)ppGpp synthase/HD superfamily hydrolase